MPRPSEIITASAALMNDAAQTLYTNAATLPYLNMALDILQELYELNGIPTTNSTSAAITVPAGIKKVGFDTVPALPSDLIEIQQLWESGQGLNQWIPMTKRDFLPHYLEDNQLISQFIIWSWKHQAITVIPANQPNDLKIDYTASIFNTPVLIGNINVNLPFTNIKTFLEFETAALCAYFVAENETRFSALNSFAADALTRALGIPIKGMQTIITRRRPFRYNLKTRANTWRV